MEAEHLEWRRERPKLSGNCQYRHLMVWEHRQGRWQITANQITPILKK